MTTNGTTSRTGAMSGQVLSDAARRMLPVLAGRVLTAVADRAVEKVEGLADRIDERRTGERPESPERTGRTGRTGSSESSEAADDAPSGSGGRGAPGAAWAFVVEQARAFLALVVRLAAQAVELLRRATEKLRSRRAPEGIDEAPEPDEITAPEDLEDDLEDDDEGEFEDDYEDDVQDEDEFEDDEVDDEERVTAGV